MAILPKVEGDGFQRTQVTVPKDRKGDKWRSGENAERIIQLDRGGLVCAPNRPGITIESLGDLREAQVPVLMEELDHCFENTQITLREDGNGDLSL